MCTTDNCECTHTFAFSFRSLQTAFTVTCVPRSPSRPRFPTNHDEPLPRSGSAGTGGGAGAESTTNVHDELLHHHHALQRQVRKAREEEK